MVTSQITYVQPQLEDYAQVVTAPCEVLAACTTWRATQRLPHGDLDSSLGELVLSTVAASVVVHGLTATCPA